MAVSLPPRTCRGSLLLLDSGGEAEETYQADSFSASIEGFGTGGSCVGDLRKSSKSQGLFDQGMVETVVGKEDW